MTSTTGGDRFTPSPGRFGLTDEHAERELRAAGWWDSSGPTDAGLPVLGALSRSPDPDLALRSLDRLRESAEDEWPVLSGSLTADAGLRGRLIGVLGSSVALADYLVAHPEQWHRLASLDQANVRATS